MQRARYLAIGVAMAAALSNTSQAETTAAKDIYLEPVVISSPRMSSPLQVSSDTRQPRMPLPAQDGGAFLKSIPGFSLSRKGGTSGDPEFRGLGGSRLGILMDDSHLYGGCGMRMDPPTAYIFPQAYDRIEVIKGPQSVRHGASSAGIARFERDKPLFVEPTIQGFASMTVGSFGRTDLVTDITGGDAEGYFRVVGTLSEQDDYRDGDGERIHSNYTRWSGTGVIGWTPTADQLFEFTYERSDAEAAYDDRGMDGTEFDRTGYRLAYSHRNINDWLDEITLSAFENRIDHVMDNFRLRQPPGMPMISYPSRDTRGARITLNTRANASTAVNWGLDIARDEHRSGGPLMGPNAFAWRDTPQEDTARFTGGGVFAELSQSLSTQSALHAGLRVDEQRALAQRSFGGAASGDERDSTLTSGFMRYEYKAPQRPASFHIGLGRAERAADYWESRRVFELDSEALTQIDFGVGLRGAGWQSTLSIFYGEFDNYILIVAPGVEDDEARNIDATTFGAEADLLLALSDRLSMTLTAAWVRSENDTDDQPLAQTPPPQGTISLDYQDQKHFAGIQVRGVARQHRIHQGYGTIYSLDTEKTSGFGTASLYLGRDLFSRATVTLGVDNLFDRTYAEHIQRGSADLGASSRAINEPGRVLWANLTTQF